LTPPYKQTLERLNAVTQQIQKRKGKGGAMNLSNAEAQALLGVDPFSLVCGRCGGEAHNRVVLTMSVRGLCGDDHYTRSAVLCDEHAHDVGNIALGLLPGPTEERGSRD
jgi:hypothetical protein